MTLARAAPVLLALLAASAGAQEFGPDTCVSGYVWREAFSGDHVCVDPTVRAEAATDNQLAPRRRMPGGGQFGADTCRPGYVWREARPEDHVCVTPQTREQTASDNRAAVSRVVRAQVAPAARPQLVRDAVDRHGALSAIGNRFSGAGSTAPGVRLPPPRPASGSEPKRGFDEDGNPYIEDALPDGSRRRQQKDGVTVIRPDGTSQHYPAMVIMANAQPPTPPELPEDPTHGLHWVNFHNGQLLDLIAMLIKFDAAQMDQFHRAENKHAGPDPFRQIRYRTDVLTVLARP